MPRHEITWLHTRLSPGSAVQSRKFWVAKRTNHGGLLGGPCYLWVVGMYDVVGNENETAMSLCVIYFKQYQMVRDWYFELYFSVRFENSQAVQQQYCRVAYHISK